MRRRAFLGSASLLLLGSGYGRASQAAQQAAPKGADLRDELSADELTIVNGSVMARDIDNYFGKGFS